MLSVVLQVATNLYGESNDYNPSNGRSRGSGFRSGSKSGYTKVYKGHGPPAPTPTPKHDLFQAVPADERCPSTIATDPQYSLLNPKFYLMEVINDWNYLMDFLYRHTGIGLFDHMHYKSGEGDPWHWSHLVALLLALLFLFALYNMLMHGMGVGTAIDPFAAARERDRMRAEREGLNEPPKYRSVSEAPNLSAANRYRQNNGSQNNNYYGDGTDQRNGRRNGR